jgi:hypothetical protein
MGKGTGYPAVLSEDETIDRALAGASLSRYGDGELRVALGGDCISQVRDPRLAREMQEVLKSTKHYLPCIPNAYSKSPKRDAWLKYATPGYTRLYDARLVYGSSLITRPDSAPWIDRPDYWEKVRSLWRDRDVTLAIGTERSLRVNMMPEAKSIRVVMGPRRDAFAEIDRIEEEIGTPSGPVIICMGCTATVLAPRLARKGVWALDLGHIGMFMRARGAFTFKLDDLASEEHRVKMGDLISGKYQADQAGMLAHGKWGKSGHKQVHHVIEFAKQLEPNARVVLDYGCGQGSLGKAIKENYPALRVWEYDPCVKGKEGMPKVADMVACTDVLEHVEPAKLDNVLSHIYGLADRACFLQIATRVANRTLPDGRNVHLIVENAEWWIARLAKYDWKLIRQEGKEGHDVRLWYLKPDANCGDNWHDSEFRDVKPQQPEA